jgi:hypothetical protein
MADTLYESDTEYVEVEANAIEAYIKNIYAKKVNEPLYPSGEELSFWRIAGIEAIMFTIAGFGIAIFSSVRTGGLFYILETLLLTKYNLGSGITTGLSLTSMITSLLAFELYVLADGFTEGRENHSVVRSKIGVMASLGVIVVAGVFT